MINNFLEAKAEKLLIQAECFTNPPINIQSLCDYLKIRVEGLELDSDVSGFLAINEEEAVIGYNKNHGNERKRFTIAHEISHFILHAKKDSPLFIDKDKKPEQSIMFRDATSSTGEFIQEREANAFAAALLMPKKAIEQTLKEREFADLKIAISKLAETFEVSNQAMSIRLANLEIIDYNVG